MDSPGREPPVTMMDWRTGSPTAKYWVLYLLLTEVAQGDSFVETSSSSPAVFAQGFLHGRSVLPQIVLEVSRIRILTLLGFPSPPSSDHKVLLINKLDAPASIHLGSNSCTYRVVDCQSNEAAPRQVNLIGNCTITLQAYATAIARL